MHVGHPCVRNLGAETVYMLPNFSVNLQGAREQRLDSTESKIPIRLWRYVRNSREYVDADIQPLKPFQYSTLLLNVQAAEKDYRMVAKTFENVQSWMISVCRRS